MEGLGSGILHPGHPVLIIADIGHNGPGGKQHICLGFNLNTFSSKKKKNPCVLLGYLSILNSAVCWSLDPCLFMSFFFNLSGFSEEKRVSGNQTVVSCFTSYGLTSLTPPPTYTFFFLSSYWSQKIFIDLSYWIKNGGSGGG